MIEATEAGVIGGTEHEGAVAPSYLEGGKVSVEAVGEMFRAATVLRAMKPWERLGEEHPLRLDIPKLGVHRACVVLIGILGESRGLLIFPSLEHFERFNDAARQSPGSLPEDMGTSVRSFTLERGADVPESMRKEVSTHGWPLMDAESYPVLEHRTAQSVPLELADLDLQIVAATVRSLCTFVLSFGDQIQGGDHEPRSESYKEGDGLVVRLTCPYESFDEFDDVPEDARFESVLDGEDGPDAEADEYADDRLDDEQWMEFEALSARRGIPIDALYGILAAVASHPSMNVTPGKWLPLILGSPGFADGEDPRAIVGLIMDAYNSTCADLEKQNIVIPPASQREALRHWCQGYMEGMALDEEWAADSMAVDMLDPIQLLAGATLEGEASAAPDEVLADAVESADVEDAVLDAHGYFRELRLTTEVRNRTPERREKEKVGRNDPCPCGSGKKYKKCCAGK